MHRLGQNALMFLFLFFLVSRISFNLVSEIGVHFFEKNKVTVTKENCANNFQYRLNFSKKNLKVSYCQENNFFQPNLSKKDEKR